MSKVCVFLVVFICLSCNASAQSPAPIKLIDCILSPSHQDWNYLVNEQATVQVSVRKYGVPMKNVTIEFEVGPEMLPPDKKETINLKDGEGIINLGTTKQPGFRQLVVKVLDNGRLYSEQVKVGYSPDKIEPTVPMPVDFEKFWSDAKMEAAKIPMDAIVSFSPELSTSTIDVFLVNLQNYKLGQRMYGYLSKPKALGKYPMLFEPPGAGIKSITPSISLAAQGFIVFNIEIHGLSPLLDGDAYKNITNAFGDYVYNNLDNADNYYYKRVYLGCVRAIDFLCSLPEYSGNNIGVTGGSQGGALAIVTAALDNRVKAVSAFYPALCDITGYLHGRAGGWPHLLNAKQQPSTNKPDKLRTISYYDVVNFAKLIKIPGFYSWGYNDNTVPPTSVFAAINVVKAPKTVVITPISGHWRFGETNQESIAWLKKHLSIK